MRFFCITSRSVRRLFFILALFLSVSFSACAAEKLTIVRGIGNYPPLEMLKDGQLTGLHIDMLRHVADTLGIELEFTSLPWGRAIKYFAMGKFGAISYFGYTKEREKFSYYHPDNVLSDTDWVFLALEERKHEFNIDPSLSGLEDLVIGVQNGYSHGKHFDSLKTLKRDAVINEFDLERMLKKRRHDLAMMSHQEFLGFQERGDFQGIVALSPEIDPDPQYIAFSRINSNHKQLKILSELFAKELKRFKTSHKYEKLLIKYDFHSSKMK